MVRVQFADVVHQENQYVVLLLEKEQQKLLGIWTGFTEGTMIAWLARGKPRIWEGPRRPSTFKFATELLKQAGVTFRGTAIRSIKRNVYLGVIQVLFEEKKINIDARPSDAVALALEMGLPIYSDADILRDSGWSLDSVYRKTTIGKSTEVLVSSLETFWLANDSKIYLNSVIAHNEIRTEAEEDTKPVPVRFLDVLRIDDLESRVVFWDKNFRRMLPVRMTSWEAANLAWLAGGQPVPADQPRRPQTYQLIGSILKAAGIGLRGAHIRDLKDGIFYGGVEAQIGEKVLRVDARPVDAVGLALALQAPIFASEGVLAPASLAPSQLYRSRSQIGRGFKQMIADMKAPSGGAFSPGAILQRLGHLLGG